MRLIDSVPIGRFTGGANTRQVLRFVLAAQCLLAVLLVISDIGGNIAEDFFADEETVEGPVTPGDQRRRYGPSRKPADYLAPDDVPSLTLPPDLPARLEFTLQSPDGFGNILVINGEIESGDASRFAAFLESLDSPVDGVAINSSGGIVDEALSIGRTIRSKDFKSMILPGSFCMSACPYILAGGAEREVSLRGAVGLHQHYYETPGYYPAFLAVEDIQHGQGRTMDFLIEMGIDPGLMLYSLNTPPDDIYVLVEDELLSTRLATEILE